MKCIDKECECRELNGGDEISDFYFCKECGLSVNRGEDECLFDKWDTEQPKKKAIEDFKIKFKYIMNELRAFETMLLDTDTITDNIVEVDCMGKPIKV